MIFNGTKKDYLKVSRKKTRPAFAPMERGFVPVMGMPGAHLSHSNRQIRQLDIPVRIEGQSITDLQKVKEDLAEWLVHDDPKELTFSDEPDRIYYAVVSGGLNLDELVRWGQGIITFLCPAPFKYGLEKTLTFPTDAVVVENKGTAEADPIFELTAKEKTTFAMISNGEEYNLIGKPADVNVQIVDEKTLLLDELGDTVSDWDDVSSQGSFSSDSNGIYVSSYGTGDDWHGPQIEKEITPTEDFEIELYTNVRTEQDKMTFRTSLNFYDENMNDLGLLRVWDKSNRRTAKIIEARIGSYTGTNHENYLISSNNYLWEGQRVYNGIIRVTRKGQMWTFYAAHITQRGNHIETITQTYNDRNNEFAGKLKFIRVSSTIHGSNPKPNGLSIRRVRVRRLNKITVDQTPYILDVGDVVTLDHKDDEILINGEPRNDLKNFGGSFFKLAKDDNTLLVTPEDSFDTQVTFRDKYL